MAKNLYEILEIKKEATLTEIKIAYANMLRKYPPEKFNKEFSTINSAYEVLSNKAKRYEYDQFNGYDMGSQSLLDEGIRLIKSGNMVVGRNKLSSFLKREGNVPGVMHELAKAYAHDEDYVKAYTIQKTVLDKTEKLTFEHMNWMLFYLYRLEDRINLNSYMKKAILKFKNPKIYFNIINWYIEDEKYDEAKELLFDNAISFVNKKGGIKSYCELSKLLFQVGENEFGEQYLDRAIKFSVEFANENADKLEKIKTTIITVISFENSKEISRIVDELSNYINNIKNIVEEKVYKDNLGWISVSNNLIKELVELSERQINENLKDFILTSVKKRISIDETFRNEMTDELRFYLKELKNDRNQKQIKENLSMIEKANPNIYELDTKCLFDKYGGYIPYDGKVKNGKERKTEKKGKKEKKGGANSMIFVCLIIIIIFALIQFV